jgi:hypothetical protein
VAHVTVPSMLAAQAHGQRRFEVKGEAETIGDAVRALPVADLLFNERGEWNRYLNLYVDGADARDRGGLACPLAGVRELRIVGILAGG